MLIRDNLPDRKISTIQKLYIMKKHGYCNVFLKTILRVKVTEAHIYIGRHQGMKYAHCDVGTMIYHKFSEDMASYKLSMEN